MRSEIIHGVLPARFLAVLLVMLYCFLAVAQTTNFIKISTSNTSSFNIKTVFVKDGELSEEEIIQVIKLANRTGLTNVAQVSTFYFLPGGGKGIAVKSVESHDGRNTRFETVYIDKVGWSFRMTNSGTKLTGNFWLEDGGKVLTLLRDYKSTKGPDFQVSLGDGVDNALADTVVDLFMEDKLQFLNKIMRFGDTNPKSIRKPNLIGDYEMQLDNYPTTVLRFKSENGKVIVTSILEFGI